MPRLGGGDPCMRCGETVYEAEKQTCSGRIWHKKCFACANCKKKLDSVSVNENKENQEIYCKGCYAKLYGPKGYGFGQGAGALHLTGQTS